MKKIFGVTMALAMLAGLILLLPITSVSAQQLGEGREGILGCGGNHQRRYMNSELTFTSFTFSNFNADRTLIIEKFTLFDAEGGILASFPPFDSLPPSLQDKVKTELGPNQTANFSTIDIFGTYDVQANKPFQAVVKWRTADGRKGLELWGTIGRQDRGLYPDPQNPDPPGGRLLEQRARGPLWCATLSLK
jgi:hypothetical protein